MATKIRLLQPTGLWRYPADEKAKKENYIAEFYKFDSVWKEKESRLASLTDSEIKKWIDEGKAIEIEI